MGGSPLGTPAALDASGNATVSGITLPEGSVTIVATTNNIPNRGVGTGSVTVTVDLGPPAAPTNLTAVVADRRRTSMQLAWTAPSDNGGGTPVAGYDIRYAKTQITDDTSFNAATAVTYTGVPPQPGQPDGILVDRLYIENGYFFAVKARDAAGNLSPLIGTTTAVTAHFNVTLIPSPSATNQAFGATHRWVVRRERRRDFRSRRRHVQRRACVPVPRRRELRALRTVRDVYGDERRFRSHRSPDRRHQW